MKKKKDVDVQRFIFGDVLCNHSLQNSISCTCSTLACSKEGTMEKMTDPSFMRVLHLALMTNRLTNCHVDASYLSGEAELLIDTSAPFGNKRMLFRLFLYPAAAFLPKCC